MKKIASIIFLLVLGSSSSYGQFLLPFQIRWMAYPWANKTALAQGCLSEKYVGKRALEKRKNDWPSYYYSFDTLGRHTHTSFGNDITPNGEKVQVWFYDDTGCPYLSGSSYSDKRRTYFGDTTGGFFHCENGWLDTVYFCDYSTEMQVRIRDDSGRLGELQIWKGDTIFHCEKYKYDNFGMLKGISGTVIGEFEYSEDGKKIKFVSYYPKWNEWATTNYYLNEHGLLTRIESGDNRINPRRPRPNEVQFYEWKLREPK